MQSRFHNNLRLTLLLLIQSLCTLTCDAQDNGTYVISKNNSSLQSFSTKSIKIDHLRKFNPQIKNDSVKIGDTVFLTKAKLEEVPEHDSLNNLNSPNTDNFSSIYREITFQGKSYMMCIVDPSLYEVEIFNIDESTGEPYTFRKLRELKKDKLLFAMNGGMFQSNYAPEGLFISDGKVLSAINLRKDNNGNFYNLPPNGIFSIDFKGNPTVVESDKFTSLKIKPRIATQSGPMLVIDSTFNKGFNKGSSNINIRNGVGINSQKQIVFVISEDPVNFYEFSELFRDKLNCNNALYLDGVVSEIYIPEMDEEFSQKHQLGTFITVSKRLKKHKNQKNGDRN